MQGSAGLLWAWRLARCLEGWLALTVAGSVVAFGSVHPWAYWPLLCSSLVAGLAALGWAWLVALDPGRMHNWRVPLLPPAILLLGLALAQLAPWPSLGPVTVSVADSLRGVAFLAGMLCLHLAARIAFDDRSARHRLQGFVAVLTLGLAVEGLVQASSGASLIYGWFRPLEGGTPFGPFANRNHFAGYMLLTVPTSLAVSARAIRRLRTTLGPKPALGRLAGLLSGRPGASILLWGMPAVAGAAALVATTSRGGLAAFVFGMPFAFLARRGRSVGAPLVLVLVLTVTGGGWYWIEQATERVGWAARDAPERVSIWRDALLRLEPRHWIAGTGLNTFGPALWGATPFALPLGATPWPAEVSEALAVRVTTGSGGTVWYREAHNDYLQILVEMGVPGLLVALWAAIRALRASRVDPWLAWATASLLLHEAVDFDLQIPAVAVLFVVLLGAAPDRMEARGALVGRFLREPDGAANS